MEEVSKEAYTLFVEEQLIGNINLWAKMTKVKLLTWYTAERILTLQLGLKS